MGRWATRLVVCLCLCPILVAGEQAGVWLDVPFVRQEKNGCGAASIAMVMKYWQRLQTLQPETPDAGEIQRALYSPRAGGIFASELKGYLQQHGFRTFAFRGE